MIERIVISVGMARWVAELRQRYSRFHAFQREVDHALAEVSS